MSSVMKESIPRYCFNITHYCWSCGDGCCSDSGYIGNIVDTLSGGSGLVFDEMDWNSWPYREQFVDMLVSKLEEQLDRPVKHYEDYRVEEDTKYSGDEDDSIEEIEED